MATSLVVAGLLLAGCGSDDGTVAGSTTTSADDTTTTAAEATTTTTAPVGLEQPAIWPAADVVFTTPEAAAEDFVSKVLGVPPALGEFQAGDERSGEMEVLSPGEGSGPSVPRGLLLLRQLGPDDGWFILAAVNDSATVATPASAGEVAAGPVTVEGVARGFEANVVVRAFVAGDETQALDQVITMGGAMETPEPYSVSLDLTGAEPGQIVVIVVQGGTGLETDPGDFAAQPVVIAG